MIKKIALIGLKGTGKDTLVNLLRDSNTKATIYNFKFANPVNTIIQLFFKIPENTVEASKTHLNFKFENGKSIRDLQQFIGQGFKKFDPFLWIRAVRHYIEQVEKIQATINVNEESFIIISDLRFPHEFFFLEEHGFLIIDLNRINHLAKEKAIVKYLGHNWFSRLIMRFINPSLAHVSEWNYWKLRKKAHYSISFENKEDLLSHFQSIAIIHHFKDIDNNYQCSTLNLK